MIAVYPGSFNPLHKGHLDVIEKVLPLVSILYLAIGKNANKVNTSDFSLLNHISLNDSNKILVHKFDGKLVDYVKQVKGDCVIRGLRNGQDFEYEKTMQYWNEDLGLVVPTLYIISDRELVHISSSAIRTVEILK